MLLLNCFNWQKCHQLSSKIKIDVSFFLDSGLISRTKPDDLKNVLNELEHILVDSQSKNINQTYNGKTLLSIAAQHDQILVVEALLAKGAAVEDLNLIKTCIEKGTNSKQEPLLYKAAQKGWSGMVQALLRDHKGPINQPYFGRTPLFIAAQNGHVNIVSALLSEGADPSIQFNNISPLYVAARNGHLDIVNALVSYYNANINDKYNGNTPIQIAIKNKHIDIVAALLDKGATITDEDITLLLDNIGDINKKYNKYTLIDIAANNDHIELFAKLLDKGANIGSISPDIAIKLVERYGIDKTYNGKTLLCIGAEKNQIGLCETMLSKNAKLDKTSCNALVSQNGINKTYAGSTLLSIAVKQNNENVIAQLLNKGAKLELNHVNTLIANKMLFIGKKPLLNTAVEQGQIEVIQALIEAGAPLNSAYEVKTPLIIAAQSGFIDVVKQLLQAGADINFSPYAGVTMFSRVLESIPIGRVNNTHQEIFELLLEKGTKIESFDIGLLLERNKINKTYNGKTLLYIAAERGQLDIVKRLLNNKADINFKCNDMAPIDIAFKEGNVDVVKALLNKGATITPKNNQTSTSKTMTSETTRPLNKKVLEILLGKSLPNQTEKSKLLESIPDFDTKKQKNMIIRSLECYIKDREKEGEYTNRWKLGFSKTEKIDAANTLLSQIKNNAGSHLDQKQIKILKDGRLSSIFKLYQETMKASTTEASKQQSTPTQDQEQSPDQNGPAGPH